MRAILSGHRVLSICLLQSLSLVFSHCSPTFCFIHSIVLLIEGKMCVCANVCLSIVIAFLKMRNRTDELKERLQQQQQTIRQEKNGRQLKLLKVNSHIWFYCIVMLLSFFFTIFSERKAKRQWASQADATDKASLARWHNFNLFSPRLFTSTFLPLSIIDCFLLY